MIAEKKKIITGDRRTELKETVYLLFKRIFDILFSTAAIVLLLIPMCIVAILVKAQDGGCVFYRAKRLGQYGKPFEMLKFRSMKPGSNELESILSAEELEIYKKEFKLENDPRLTKFGAFIRKMSIDEIPQFFNVLSGEMSMVGPRPIVFEEREKYGDKIDLFLSVKPGLTGYWQAYARNNAGYSNGKRQKMELYYIANRCTWFDIKIIFATIFCVLTQKGAQ